MILLMQIRDKESKALWNDSQVPLNTCRPPIRGETPICETPQEVANLLVQSALEGYYRVVLDNGEIWRITIVRATTFVSEIIREDPYV